MPIRNPFARRPGAAPVQDENINPGSIGDPAYPGFEKVDTTGSKSSLALSVRTGKDIGEYKMSVVNDSGVYLPPSPTEKESSWPRRYALSRNSTDTRGSDNGDIEHFSISRESFDSYRRSFDICARSPVVLNDAVPRASMDSSRFPRLQRPSLHPKFFEPQPPLPAEEEADFEDVGLNDDNSRYLSPVQQQHPKKRSFFSKFGSDHTNDAIDAPPANAAQSNTQMMSRFLPGRKRGQSGQGAELRSMSHSEGPIDGVSTPVSVVQEQGVAS